MAREALEAATDAQLLDASPIKLSQWCPHIPTPRQRAFLSLDTEEALYGGAAGGGKSDALLMWALEGVDAPGYSAILFRRTFPELIQAGGLIFRSKEWLTKTPAQWNGTSKTWTFPSGAVISFASMQRNDDAMKYQGGEYIRACFDELTHFSEFQYTWILSRLRRIVGFPFAPQMRAGSNPGSSGHLWVKSRFVTKEAIDALKTGQPLGVYWRDDRHPDGQPIRRAFVPARLDDNPHLDREEYRRKLMQLPPVTRERILNGDWSVVEDAVIRPDWLRSFDMRGEHIQAMDAENNFIEGGQIDCRQLNRFATIDTAGTEEDKAKERRGKPASWSVCQIWDHWPQRKWLFLRDQWRARVGWDGLKAGLKTFLAAWEPKQVIIENAHWGLPLSSELRNWYVTMVQPHGKTKLERSTVLQNKLERGEVFLPYGNAGWRMALEGEWLSWTGDPDEQADQVDAASYAARHVTTSNEGAAWGGVIRP